MGRDRSRFLLRRESYPGIPLHAHTSSSGKIRRCCVDQLNPPPKVDIRGRRIIDIPRSIAHQGMLQSGALLRGSSLGEAMIRTTVLRAVVLTSAFAAALTPVTCLGENSNPLPAKAIKLPAKATKKLPPEL